MSETTAWFYLRAGQQVGPVTTAQIRTALGDGTLALHDLVWRQGLPNWVPASALPEFSASAAPSPATSPAVIPSTDPYLTYASAGPGYAGFWKRFAALIIDWLVLGAIMGILGVRHASTGALGLIVGWLYFALMESSNTQGTLGKMALSIKVTDLNGHKITFANATGRHFAKIISALILGIGFLMAALTARKQALHDILADCLVVNRT